MNTMEFEEMKKIWDKQNQEPLYAINEEALHNRILAKKQNAGHITNFSELLLIVVNSTGTAIILLSGFIKNSENIFLYVLAGLMLVTAVSVFIGRVRRNRRVNSFNQSLLGDLDHAIANANYQVKLSQIMRWYILPVGVLTALAIWENFTFIWVLLIVLFFALTWYVGSWEHRIYVRKKHELEALHTKLTEERNEN